LIAFDNGQPKKQSSTRLYIKIDVCIWIKNIKC